MALQDGSGSTPDVGIDEEQKLKYLEGIQTATTHAVSCVSNLYEYVKEKSGPLKPSVQSVEGTVKTVVAPAYEKLHDVPSDVLKYVDHKVDASVTGLKQRATLVKQASSKAVSTAQAAPSVAVDTAKQLYSKYEPIAEQCAASTWQKLNQLPVFPKVADAVIPTAAQCAEKYNQTIQSTAEKGYKISSYLPLVPTERLAKVFNGTTDAAEGRSTSAPPSDEPPAVSSH